MPCYKLCPTTSAIKTWVPKINGWTCHLLVWNNFKNVIVWKMLQVWFLRQNLARPWITSRDQSWFTLCPAVYFLQPCTCFWSGYDCQVLGGTGKVNVWERDPSKADRESILRRCKAMLPSLEHVRYTLLVCSCFSFHMKGLPVFTTLPQVCASFCRHNTLTTLHCLKQPFADQSDV